MYLFSRMFTLSYYCPFIDFISSTHGTVLLLKNYNGNKTKKCLDNGFNWFTNHLDLKNIYNGSNFFLLLAVYIWNWKIKKGNPKTILGFLQKLECNNNFSMHLHLSMYKQSFILKVKVSDNPEFATFACQKQHKSLKSS